MELILSKLIASKQSSKSFRVSLPDPMLSSYSNTPTDDIVNDSVVSIPVPMSNTNMNPDAFPVNNSTANIVIDFVDDFSCNMVKTVVISLLI